MKKLLLATAVAAASLSFGASAVQFNNTVDFKTLSNTDQKQLKLKVEFQNAVCYESVKRREEQRFA